MQAICGLHVNDVIYIYACVPTFTPMPATIASLRSEEAVLYICFLLLALVSYTNTCVPIIMSCLGLFVVVYSKFTNKQV